MAVKSAAHIPKQPRGFIVIRFAQLSLALACLGLCIAIAITISNLQAILNPLTTSVFTIATTIYIVVTELGRLRQYNCIAITILDCLNLLFWLASFSTMLHFTRGANTLADEDGLTLVSFLLEATALVSGSALILFLISLIVFSVYFARHRKQGIAQAVIKGGAPGPIYIRQVGPVTGKSEGPQLQMARSVNIYQLSPVLTQSPQLVQQKSCDIAGMYTLCDPSQQQPSPQSREPSAEREPGPEQTNLRESDTSTIETGHVEV